MTSKTKPAIRRNADGTRNLRDLRAVLDTDGASVRKQGGQWIVTRYNDAMRVGIETPLHYSIDTERAAIEAALQLDAD